METIWKDIKYGVRILGKSPGVTAVAILSLALGIGASTAIFSVAKPVLLEPFPYPSPGRIVMIRDAGSGGPRGYPTFGTYRELIERSRSFEAMAATRFWQPTMTGPAEPERLDGQRVNASYFRVLGVPPARGRDFAPGDDRAGGPRVAILSDGLWRRRFAADPTIIGRQIKLDDESYDFIGVMPAAFENVLAPSAKIWAPLQYDISQGRAWGHHLSIAGRLKPGIGIQQARRELNSIAGAPVPEFSRAPWASLQQGLVVTSLQEEVAQPVKPALFAAFGAVLLLLLIACVNVTNLLVARGVQRSGEFAVRAALGADRARLVRQLTTESAVLAVFGAALGMVVAAWSLDVFIALAPPSLPRVSAMRIDGAVFGFGVGISTLNAAVVGLLPALRVSRGDLRSAIQQVSSRAAGGHQWTRRTLVACEVALAFVLLISAGLLLNSLQRLFAIPPGFEARQLLVMQIQASGRRFNDAALSRRFFEQALEEVRRVPGVAAAALTSQLPLSGDEEAYGVRLALGPVKQAEAGSPAFRYSVSLDYFETMGIPLRRGRLLDARDAPGAPSAVLISESLARRNFGEQEPVGQQISVGPENNPLYEIVGVVGDVKQTSLGEQVSDAFYIAPGQGWFADRAMWLVVRGQGDPATLVPAIRKAIWSVDKDQPIVRAGLMEGLLAASAADLRFALALFEAFGLVALALAAAGIYGVLSGSVTERTREIGIRLALGARPVDVLQMVMGEGLRLAVAGLAAGLLLALLFTRLLTNLLFGVKASDPLTFAMTAGVLCIAAVGACFIPARRATKVDPIVALRYE